MFQYERYYKKKVQINMRIKNQEQTGIPHLNANGNAVQSSKERAGASNKQFA